MEGNKTKIAIIGYGFVGKATARLLGLLDTKFDIQIEDPDKDYIIENWKGIQYAFICVPTNLKNGKLDNSIIDNILSKLYVGVVPVIRSTIGPDQCVEYARKGCIIMPEFLREKHWKEDVDDPNIDIIVGHRNYDDFVDMMSCGPKFVKPVNPVEASMMKLLRNAALAVKVGLANDFKNVCDGYNIDYETIKEFLEADPNLGGTHWAVPGPDGKHGFGGTCLPKDLTHASSLCYNADSIMKVALEANKSRRNNE